MAPQVPVVGQDSRLFSHRSLGAAPFEAPVTRTKIDFSPLPETSVFRNDGGGITVMQINHDGCAEMILLPLSFVDQFCRALQEVRDAELPEE